MLSNSKKKQKTTNTHLFLHLALLTHFIFPLSVQPLFFLCTSPPAVSTILIFVVNADQSDFWDGIQRKHMYLAAAAGFVTIDLIVQLCV